MTKYDGATLQRLSFRRQFILGPRFVAGFPSWQRVALDAVWSLTVHPDLDVCRVAKGDRWIALLGYILDPVHPAASDVDIVTGLLDAFHTCDDLLEQTARFGGRWVIVAHDAVRTVVFSDAAGLRRLVYTVGSAPGQTWCASEAGLLAEILDLAVDDDVLTVAKLNDPRSLDGLSWIPGDTTPYTALMRLLPNHYLDLPAAQPHRFWPTADLPALPLGAAIARSSEMLLGLMDSARHRFDLMVALTAGWDSRLTLAAARPWARHALFYTAVLRHTADGAPDVTVPSRLLPKLGLKHEILDCRDNADEEFRAIYRRNVQLAHDQHCSMAQALLDGTPSRGVCVTGDVGEIAKCAYRVGPSSNRDVTAHDLAVLARLPPNRFVLHAFERWLADALAQSSNVPLLDLYCWEQEAGRLQARIQSECDIARESFAPMNCRSLLTTMLSAPERYRQEPTLDLFRGIMKRLWPEVLSEPINGRPQAGVEAAVSRALSRLGLLRVVPRPVKGLAKGLIRAATARKG